MYSLFRQCSCTCEHPFLLTATSLFPVVAIDMIVFAFVEGHVDGFRFPEETRSHKEVRKRWQAQQQPHASRSRLLNGYYLPPNTLNTPLFD